MADQINTWGPLRKWAKDAANGETSKIPYIDIVTLIDENAELRAALQAQQGDMKRVNYLETMVVNVRTPLRYGSRDLFWASPPDDDGEAGPSDIRAKIDAALAARREG